MSLKSLSDNSDRERCTGNGECRTWNGERRARAWHREYIGRNLVVGKVIGSVTSIKLRGVLSHFQWLVCSCSYSYSVSRQKKKKTSLQKKKTSRLKEKDSRQKKKPRGKRKNLAEQKGILLRLFCKFQFEARNSCYEPASVSRSRIAKEKRQESPLEKNNESSI